MSTVKPGTRVRHLDGTEGTVVRPDGIGDLHGADVRWDDGHLGFAVDDEYEVLL